MTNIALPNSGAWRRLWGYYIAIGGVLAAPVCISYMYATAYLSWHSLIHGGLFSFSGAGAVMMTIVTMVTSTALRMVLWPLSFLLWFNDYPAATSFWQWLAPGFYISVGGS